MHRLLQRQLRKVFPQGLPDDPKIQLLVELVESGYQSFSEQLTILERSLDISSDELNQRNQTLNSILDSLPDMSLWMDRDGIIRDVRIGHFDPPLLSHDTDTDCIFELAFIKASSEFQAFLENYQSRGGRSEDIAFQLDDHEYRVRANITAVGNHRWLLVLQDIYLRKKLEEMQYQRLQQSKRAEKQLQQLVNSAPIGILICDPRLNILMTNDFICQLFGMSEQDVLSHHPMDFISLRSRELFQRYIQKTINEQDSQEIARADLLLMLPEKKDIPIEMAFSRLVFEGKPMIIMSITDISERKKLEAMLRNLAATDPLTGAFNRRSFMEQAEKSIKTCQRWNCPLSIMILDIDHFKQFNDSYGHAAGDLVLVELVKMADLSTREIDIIGRLGGEEFAVVLPGLGEKEAFEVAKRLRSVVENMQVNYEQQPLQMTISIGVATLQPSELNTPLEQLMKQADEGLYYAKAHGRNCVISPLLMNG
ncbi:sensor domain-containing diguanylate cyclase [Vibrio vulnificus]|uniref:sensor domain-containing diguanylate cyclase n=1 Tax=Vibrio vulnificus TaxID=672 RepID=UPI003EDAFCB1